MTNFNVILRCNISFARKPCLLTNLYQLLVMWSQHWVVSSSLSRTETTNSPCWCRILLVATLKLLCSSTFHLLIITRTNLLFPWRKLKKKYTCDRFLIQDFSAFIVVNFSNHLQEKCWNNLNSLCRPVARNFQRGLHGHHT